MNEFSTLYSFSHEVGQEQLIHNNRKGKFSFENVRHKLKSVNIPEAIEKLKTFDIQLPYSKIEILAKI